MAKYEVYFSKYGQKVADAIWNSGKGGTNRLAIALGTKGTGLQAHHVIPRELISSNKVLRDAIDQGFDFNGVINGIALDATRHKGAHPNYTKFIQKYIDIANTRADLRTAKEKMEWVANYAKKNTK